MDLSKFEKLIETNDATLHEQFRNESLEFLQIKDYPNVNDIYSIAWEYGYMFGIQEVFNNLSDLAKCVKGISPEEKQTLWSKTKKYFFNRSSK